MKLYAGLAFLLIAITGLPAQAPQAAGTGVPETASATPLTAVQPNLDKLQSAASETSLAISRMRIEKWKTDSNSKQQAQSNADSIQRNVTTALPGLIAAVRSAPSDLTADFRLYRNVNALYDVMTSLTESAGAFGPKAEYEDLAQQLQTIDSVRHDMADAIEQLTASTQAELTRLQQQVRIAQQAPAAAPPKTVVVDDNAPAPAHKKKPAAKKPNTSPPAGNNSANSGEAKQ